VSVVKTIYERVPGLKPTWRFVRGSVVGSYQAIVRACAPFASRHRFLHPHYLQLSIVNRFSRRPVTSPTGTAVVTGTTHGPRIARAHIAIEAIGRGRELPQRLILWLDDDDALADLPKPLRRLQARGLEVLRSENYGVHTKYYPYVASLPRHDRPVVTYDDDIFYPKHWLQRISAIGREVPELIVTYRSHVIEFLGENMAPYQSWMPNESEEPSLLNFGTAVSGQLLPPVILNELLAEGERFREVSPTADDIWVHATAVRLGVAVRQVSIIPMLFPFVPETQEQGLFVQNVFGGRNDAQIAASYGAAEVAALRRLNATRPAHEIPTVGHIGP
jgi:hypothetical protein